MTNKYLKLMSKEYPTIDSVASEMVNLSAIRSLPKADSGKEVFQIFFERLQSSSLSLFAIVPVVSNRR